MEYYIYVTNDCNLNCSYCSVLLKSNQRHLPIKPNYELNELKKFVDTTQKAFNSETACLYFFGGEPTLDYNFIYSVIQLFQDSSEYNIKYVLHTNGLLLDKIPDTILTYIDIIFLSLNYEKIYDNNEISEYFVNFVHNIAYIKSKKDIPFIGRLTISEGASLYTECTLLGNFFDYVYWQLDNQETLNDIKRYKKQYLNEIEILFDYWYSFLKQGILLRYVPFLAILRHMINDPSVPENFYCGYGDDIVYIQTDGTCYACCDEMESKKHFIGDIYNGILFENMKNNYDRCLKCEYIKICGGRCGRMHKDFEEDRINHYCDMNRFTFKLIESHLEEIKDIISKNYNLKEIIDDFMLDYTELIP